MEDAPLNQELDPRYNREPGVAIVPGSAYQREAAKFEQFHSRFTGPDAPPGNPYTYRPFPKMLYRAERWKGSTRPVCMAAAPDRYDFPNDREYQRAMEAAESFTARCQLVVSDDREYQRAMETGWRETPQEAVDFVHERDRSFSTEVAHRGHDDRNMGSAARAEAAAAEAAAGMPVAAVPEGRRRR